MTGGRHSRRVSVSGLLAGDLIDLDQPMGSGQEDSFLIDSATDTGVFGTTPPKPKPEESAEPKPAKRRSKNKLRNSMAWDKAFLVDEVLLLDPDLDAPLLSETLTPPRTTKRPAALDIPPKKSLPETGSRPPSRARTPDLSPFAELQSNTPIPSAGPSPVAQSSSARRQKEPVQESMTWNGAFQQENDGALLTDDLPLAESPVLLTRKKSLEKKSELLESSDSCMTSGSHSRPQRSRVSRSSMAWDGSFQSGGGLLDMNLAEDSSATQTTRTSNRVSVSVLSSIESLRTEASSSSMAETLYGDEAESEGTKRTPGEGGLVGRVKERSASGTPGTPTKGERRRKPAGLHRSSSTTVAIEAAIQHGTRLRLPGRYNPNPTPLSKPKSPVRTPSAVPASKPETPTAAAPSKPKPQSDTPGGSRATSHDSSPVQKASKPGSAGFKQGLDLRTSSELEALQAQLAAIQAERDALQAKVSQLEGSTVAAQETAPESAGGGFKRHTEASRDTEFSRQKTQPVAGSALPAGSVVTGAVTSLLPKLQTDSQTVPAPERQKPIPSMLPGPAASRPSFLKRPTAKKDFFQTPTSSAPARPVSAEAPAGPSRASTGAAGGVRSSAESLRVSPSAHSQSSAATKAPSSPGLSRTHIPKAAPVPASPKASKIPQAAQNFKPSLLRKPAARGASGIAPPRSLKSGTFNASAIRSACSVPLPASPAGKADLASPSPAKKPISRMHVGAAKSPAPSQLRKSADKAPEITQKPTNPTDALGNAASEATKSLSQTGNTFVSRLAAVSGGKSTTPSGLKPPGVKLQEVTSAKLAALPRPSAIDPAIIAAACAVPLPKSLEGLGVGSSNPVLPRGVSSAADTTALPGSATVVQALKPPQPRVSFLRPPSTVPPALVTAACNVGLPPSREERKTPSAPAPSAGNLEGVQDGRCSVSEDAGSFDAKQPQSGTAEEVVCSKKQGGQLEGSECTSDAGAVGDASEVATKPGSSGTMVAADEAGPGREDVVEESLPIGGTLARLPEDVPNTCQSVEAPGQDDLSAVINHPAPAPSKTGVNTPQTAQADPTPQSPALSDALLLASPTPSTQEGHLTQETAPAVSYPSLQLPPNYSQLRRTSKKPNLPTIYSPAGGLLTPGTPTGHSVAGGRRSPLARVLFSGKLGKATRVTKQESDQTEESTVPVLEVIPGKNGSLDGLEDGDRPGKETEAARNFSGALLPPGDVSEQPVGWGRESASSPPDSSRLASSALAESSVGVSLELLGVDEEGSEWLVELLTQSNRTGPYIARLVQNIGLPRPLPQSAEPTEDGPLGMESPLQETSVAGVAHPEPTESNDGALTIAEIAVDDQVRPVGVGKALAADVALPIPALSGNVDDISSGCGGKRPQKADEIDVVESLTEGGSAAADGLMSAEDSAVGTVSEEKEGGLVKGLGGETVDGNLDVSVKGRGNGHGKGSEFGSDDSQSEAGTALGSLQSLPQQGTPSPNSVLANPESSFLEERVSNAQESPQRLELEAGGKESSALLGEEENQPCSTFSGVKVGVSLEGKGPNEARDASDVTELVTGGTAAQQQTEPDSVDPSSSGISEQGMEALQRLEAKLMSALVAEAVDDEASGGQAPVAEEEVVEQPVVAGDVSFLCPDDVDTLGCHVSIAAEEEGGEVAVEETATGAAAVGRDTADDVSMDGHAADVSVSGAKRTHNRTETGVESEGSAGSSPGDVNNEEVCDRGQPSVATEIKQEPSAILESTLESAEPPTPVTKAPGNGAEFEENEVKSPVVVAKCPEIGAKCLEPVTKSPGNPASSLFARLRARQAAVAALLDSPVKTESPEQKTGLSVCKGVAKAKLEGGRTLLPGTEEQQNRAPEGTGEGPGDDAPGTDAVEAAACTASEEGSATKSLVLDSACNLNHGPVECESPEQQPTAPGAGAADSETSSGSTGENAGSSTGLSSPGALCINNPVSAAWEGAWFGTPVAGGVRKTLGTGKAKLGKGAKRRQSAYGKDVDIPAVVALSSGVKSVKEDEMVGDEASEVPSIAMLLQGALSGERFATASPMVDGQEVARDSPKSPNLALAIPPFENPQTPCDEPRQTLEGQFDCAGGTGNEAQWDACLAWVGRKKRGTPPNLLRTLSGKRAPMRRSAEDLWPSAGSGRPGVSPGFQISTYPHTPGRSKNPLSESAPGLAGLMQSVINASARKEENTAPGPAAGRVTVTGRKKMPGLSVTDLTVSWNDDDFEARIRAAEADGESALSSKSGRVQASPPDKGDEPPVNPYSPVKKRECGPFDCTKRA